MPQYIAKMKTWPELMESLKYATVDKDGNIVCLDGKTMFQEVLKYAGKHVRLVDDNTFSPYRYALMSEQTPVHSDWFEYVILNDETLPPEGFTLVDADYKQNNPQTSSALHWSRGRKEWVWADLYDKTWYESTAYAIPTVEWEAWQARKSEREAATQEAATQEAATQEATLNNPSDDNAEESVIWSLDLREVEALIACIKPPEVVLRTKSGGQYVIECLTVEDMRKTFSDTQYTWLRANPDMSQFSLLACNHGRPFCA